MPGGNGGLRQWYRGGILKRVTDFPPPDELEGVPFGPLLFEWMRKGYGLDPASGLRIWNYETLRVAVVATTLIGSDEEGESKGFKESTVKSWKFGEVPPPQGAAWNALQIALTKHITEGVRAEWSNLLFQSWDASALIDGKEARKLAYRAASVRHLTDDSHLR